MKNKIFLFIFLMMFGQSSFAILDFEDHAFPEFVTSARALAMGNAFICKVDDPWAVFYNPAGLGTVRNPTFHLSNIHLEINKGFLNLTEGNISDSGSKLNDNFTARGIRDNLIANPGNLSHARVNFFPNFTWRYFSLGYFYSHRNRAAMQDANSNIEFAERIDKGPIAALNLSLFGGILKFGGSVAILNRKQMQMEFTPAQDVQINPRDYDHGTATITTLGGRLTLPFEFLPTFSYVIRNSTEAEFKAVEGHNKPTDIPRTVDLGFSITPQVGKRMRIHMEVNWKDYTGEYKDQNGEDIRDNRKIGAGLEIDFARTIFVRMGLGDGYGSGGIGLRTKKMFVDLTTYAVDTSDASYRGEEDRRFVLSLSSGY